MLEMPKAVLKSRVFPVFLLAIALLPLSGPIRLTEGEDTPASPYSADHYKSITVDGIGRSENPHAEIPAEWEDDIGKIRPLDVSQFVSEELLGVAEGSLRAVASRMLFKQWDGLQFYFADGFTGPLFPAAVDFDPESNEVQSRTAATEASDLSERDAFLDALRGYMKNFDTLRDVRLKPLGADLPDPNRMRLQLKLRVTVQGTAQGLMRMDQCFCDAVIEEVEGYWRFTSWGPMTMKAKANGRLHFIERTGAVGMQPRFDDVIGGDFGFFGRNFDNGGLCVVDFDNDGDLDLYVCRAGPNFLYRNDGKGHFDEVGAETGTGDPGNSRGAIFADFDNDGDKDLFVANLTAVTDAAPQYTGLYWNDSKGHYTAAGEACGARLSGVYTCVAAADFDNDGFLDLFLGGNGPIEKERASHSPWNATDAQADVLLRNVGNGAFRNVTADAGILNTGWTLAATWGDYNLDGLPDLYISNDYGRNRLYHNLGRGKFTDVAEWLGVTDVGNGMACNWADYDNDGDLDLYSVNMSSTAAKRVLKFRTTGISEEVVDTLKKMALGNSLFKAVEKGKFTEVAGAAGCQSAGWAWGSEFFDYDNDGDLDLLVCNGYWSGVRQLDL